MNLHTSQQRRVLLKALLAAGAGAALPGCAVPVAESEEAQAYRLGCAAYIYGYPLIYFARMRYMRMMKGDAVTGERSRWGRWMHRNTIINPTVPGAPQTDTLYSSAWVDLGAEPYLLRIPAVRQRYWSVQFCDLLGTTFGMPNRRQTTGAALVALVGPDWNGHLPDGVTQVCRSRMRQVFLVLRMYFADDADLPRAIAVQQQFELLPLSFHAAGKAWGGTPGALPPPFNAAEDKLADFKTLQRMWRECPPPAEDADLLRPFAAIGLGAGADGYAGLSPAARRGLERAEADSRQRVMALTRKFPGTLNANGWIVPKASIGVYADRDYEYRAIVALLGTVATPPEENIYYVGQNDAAGTPYHGDARYVLHFPAGQLPDCDAFWSLHAYRYQGYTVIPNPINRYGISDRTPGLRFEADGGLKVYVQASDPGGAASANWLPVMPGTSFFLVTRGYEPRGTLRDLTWPGPRVERLA